MKTQNNIFSTLLWCNGLSNLAHFSTYALLAIYFLIIRKLDGDLVAVILLFTAIAFRISRIIFAPLIDLLGARYAMLLSMALCSFGYMSLCLTKFLLLNFFSILIIGIGYGTVCIIVRSYTSFIKNGTTLVRYSILNTVTNFSAAVGPIIGNYLIIKYPQYGLCIFSASIFLIGVIPTFFLPKISLQILDGSSWFTTIAKQFRLKSVRFTLIITLFAWFLLAQFFSFLPIYINKGLIVPHLLGTIYSLNAIVVVTLSIPLSKWLVIKNVALSWQLVIYFLLFLVGFLVLFMLPNISGLYITVILWSIGEVIMMPALNVLIVNVTQKNIRLIGFAINAIAIGLGECCGNFFGVLLANYSSTFNNWGASFLIMSFLTTIFLFFILSNLKRKELLLTTGDKS